MSCCSSTYFISAIKINLIKGYKPGMCPHVANMEHESCNITCTSDAECFADEKCCFNHCGGRHCVSASFGS